VSHPASLPPVPSATHTEGVLLTASDITAELLGEDGPVRVLAGASLAVDRGQIVDVVGPSGSGKTTLLRVLARLLPGASGRLTLDGVPAEDVAAQQWRARVALLPQKPAIAPGTVADNLTLPWRLKVRHHEPAPGEAALRNALGRVGLEAIGLERDAARLSVGQQARVALLRVVLTSPSVLLLDEPDAALDDASAEQVASLTVAFAREGGGVVRVRHQRTDGLAMRRLLLGNGVLEEVAL